jgi:transposase-like protein
MPKQYPKEQKDRAVRMLLDRLDDYPSMYAACNAIGSKLGIGSETLRRWTLQVQIDTQRASVRGLLRPRISPQGPQNRLRPHLRPCKQF